MALAKSYGLARGWPIACGQVVGWLPPPPVYTPAKARPGAAWTGVASSGYAGAPPVKAGLAMNARQDISWMHGTAAPTAHFVAPFADDPMFTADLEVQVMAFAANASDGIIGGIASVVFYVEGNSYFVTQPQARDLQVRTGPTSYDTVKTEVWPITLDWANWPANGGADIYADIIPSNPAVATRTIGPLRVYRKAGYDRTIDIAPSQSVIAGSRYQSVQAALAYLNTNGVSGEHVRLRWIEDGVVDAQAIAFTGATTNTNGRRGQVIVDANGHTVTLKRTSGLDIFRPQFNGLVWRGCVIDIANISGIYCEPAVSSNTGFRPMTFDRCEFFSTNGKGELPGNVSEGQGVAKHQRVNQVFSPVMFWRQCYVHDCHPKDICVASAIGCYIVDICGDGEQVQGSQSNLTTQGFHSALLVRNTYARLDGQVLSVPLSSISLVYTGAGTATLDLSGDATHDLATRTLTLKVNGVAVRTLVASVTVGSGIYTMQDAVNDINANLGASGWTATLLNNERRFAAIGLPSNLYVYQGATGVAVPSTGGLILSAGFDIHSDGAQLSGPNHQENTLGYGNYYLDVVAQIRFPSIQASAKSAWNCWWINDAGKMLGTYAARSGISSQYSGTHRHCGMVHCSLPDQALGFRRDSVVATYGFDMDGLCRVVGNVFEQLNTSVTGAAAGTMNAAVKGNVSLLSSSNMTGANVSGNVVAGTAVQNYPRVNVAGFLPADFTPAAGQSVRANPVARQTLLDIAGNVRPASCWPGAIAV